MYGQRIGVIHEVSGARVGDQVWRVRRKYDHTRAQRTKIIAAIAIITLLVSFLHSLIGNAQQESSHRVRFLGNDEVALDTRFRLITSAQSEILAEYFSVWDDQPSIDFLGLLLEAAKRGVKVKIIVDAMATKIPAALMTALRQQGQGPSGQSQLELKYYSAFLPYNPFRANHREHAKMLIVDGTKMILGGRNIGDKYFGFNRDHPGQENRDYIDVDTLIAGPAVSIARSNFYQVWASPMASEPSLGNLSPNSIAEDACLNSAGRRDRSKCEQDRKSAIQLIEKQTQRVAANLPLALQRMDKYRDERNKELAKVSSEIDFVTLDQDPFGVSEIIEDVKFLSHDPSKKVTSESAWMTKDLLRLLEQALPDSTVEIVTPYLVPTAEFERVFTDLIRKKVRVVVYTNSLFSTDHLISVAAYRSVREKLVKLGLEIHEFKGPETLHAKIFKLKTNQGDVAVVCTFNLNQRSANLDREVGLQITVQDPSSSLFFGDLSAKISEFRANSEMVSSDGQFVPGFDLKKWDDRLSTGAKLGSRILSIFLPFIFGST